MRVQSYSFCFIIFSWSWNNNRISSSTITCNYHYCYHHHTDTQIRHNVHHPHGLICTNFIFKISLRILLFITRKTHILHKIFPKWEYWRHVQFFVKTHVHNIRVCYDMDECECAWSYFNWFLIPRRTVKDDEEEEQKRILRSFY